MMRAHGISVLIFASLCVVLGCKEDDTTANTNDANTNDANTNDANGDSSGASCTLDTEAPCPAGTSKKPFADVAQYGVCDAGSESRYLRDLVSRQIGFCNGTSGCGYICIQNAAQSVCGGAATCAPGFNPVSAENLAAELARVTEGQSPVSNTTCQDNKILNDAGSAVATCEAKDGCDYYCVREFTIACACGTDELGVCLPCSTCTATSLVCADGSCVEISVLRAEICAQNPQAPCTEELDATIACVWSQSAPPVSCTTEALAQFTPTEEALSNCVPAEHLFTCGDGTSIPEHLRCDSNQDCADGSDEADCTP